MYFLPIENNASFFNTFLITVSSAKLSDRAVPSFLLKTDFFLKTLYSVLFFLVLGFGFLSFTMV